MDAALRALRRNLHGFVDAGLYSLLADLTAGRRSADYLPGRKTWSSCPLSYRLGFRGSTDRDCEGRSTNPFTDAWDGEDGQDYFDEAVVMNEVVAEIRRRKKQRRRLHRREAESKTA